LFIGVISSILTMLLGTFIGVAAAGKGILAPVFNGLINVFVLLPKLITLIVLASFLGSSQRNLILLISAFSWVGIARNVRAKVIHINGQTFIENCTIQGYSRHHIVLHHVIPNLYDVLVSRFLLGVNSCIMMESTLSFLGFGDLYYPTWGTMINFAYQRGAFIRQAYSYLLTPGVCIMLLSLSFYFISLWFEGRKDTILEG
jgi:peptide/nickel transport system permease protein